MTGFSSPYKFANDYVRTRANEAFGFVRNFQIYGFVRTRTSPKTQALPHGRSVEVSYETELGPVIVHAAVYNSQKAGRGPCDSVLVMVLAEGDTAKAKDNSLLERILSAVRARYGTPNVERWNDPQYKIHGKYWKWRVVGKLL